MKKEIICINEKELGKVSGGKAAIEIAAAVLASGACLFLTAAGACKIAIAVEKFKDLKEDFKKS